MYVTSLGAGQIPFILTRKLDKLDKLVGQDSWYDIIDKLGPISPLGVTVRSGVPNPVELTKIVPGLATLFDGPSLPLGVPGPNPDSWNSRIVAGLAPLFPSKPSHNLFSQRCAPTVRSGVPNPVELTKIVPGLATLFVGPSLPLEYPVPIQFHGIVK